MLERPSAGETGDDEASSISVTVDAENEPQMKFKSQVYTQASGSIGGVTYAHTRGVMYTRGRGLPTNPNTASQQLARASLSALSSQWSTLTQIQRDGWVAYATGTPLLNALGDPLTLSGQQMFVRCNAPRLRFGAALVATPPVTLGVPSFTPAVLVAFANIPGDVEIQFDNGDAWAVAVGGFMFVQLSAAISPGRTYFKGPFYATESIAGAVVPPTSPENIVMENTANVPPTQYPAAVGQLVHARIVVSLPDGRLSYEQIASSVAS